MGADGARQGCGEHQLGHLGGGIASEIAVDLFGKGVAVVGDVADHRRQQRRIDALDLVANLNVVEIQVLGADEEDVVCLTIPDTA